MELTAVSFGRPAFAPDDVACSLALGLRELTCLDALRTFVVETGGFGRAAALVGNLKYRHGPQVVALTDFEHIPY